MMQKIMNIYGKIVEFLGLTVGALVGMIAIMITLNIVLRLLGIQSINWVNEVAEYALYISAFIAAPWVLRLGQHIRIDILSNVLPKKMAYVLERFVDLIGLVICLTITYYSAVATISAFEHDSMIYKNLIIPEWPILAFIPVSFAMLSIEFILRLGTSPNAETTQETKSGGF